MKIEPERVQSIDEQIIPAKTSRSGIRQYNPKKPCKWGFKMFAGAGASGFTYDFFLYSGAKSTGGIQCTTENVVLHLVKDLYFKLCFDNWFCSLRLCLRLKDLGILTIATVRSNRNAKCPLDSDKYKYLKKRGRGASCFKTDTNSDLVVLK